MPIGWLVLAPGNPICLCGPFQRPPEHLELNAGAPFSTWTISGTYNMPLGYQDAINYGLAFRLIPRYGMSIQPQITQSVTELAQKTEARIRQMNLINRQLPKGTEENPITQEAEAAQAVK